MKRTISMVFTALFLVSVMVNIAAAASMLRWNAPEGSVVGYRIYYGLSEGNYTFSEDVGNVVEYPLSNFSLEEGTTYYFIVRAYNGEGESDNSNMVPYTVPSVLDTTPPLMPAGVTGEVVNGDIVLTWQANSELDLAEYMVYYGTAIRDYGLPAPQSGTSHTITGLTAGETYYLAVTAVDTSGNESGYSSPEVIKSIPAQITGQKLLWDAVQGEVTGYRIYYGLSEGSYTQSADAGTATEYPLADLSLTQGTNYYFVVRAYNSSGESGNSNFITTIAGEPHDSVPPTISIESPTTDASYSTGAQSIDISGSASDNEGIQEVVWTNSLGGSGTASGTTSWTVQGIPLSGGDNEITVKASDASGNQSTDTLTVSVSAPDTTAPSAPADVAGDVVSGEIQLAWTANSEPDLSGYRVYIGTSAGNYGPPASAATAEYTLSGLDTGITYYIAVTAVDASGNESTYSSPELVKAIPVGSLFGWNLKWDGVAGDVTGYRIYYGTTQGQYTQNVDVGLVTQYEMDKLSLDEGVTYYFTVRAYNSSGESGDSNIATHSIGVPIDNQAPQVAITSPTTGESYDTQSATLDIGGTASDDQNLVQVAWFNTAGGSGVATGTDSWSVSSIPLVAGENVIEVKATDGAGNESTDQFTVNYTSPDTTPPEITIMLPTSEPSYETRSAMLDMSGSASDDTGVTEVIWSNSAGGGGQATGTSSWSVTSIFLVEGQNVIQVTAKDEGGNQSTDQFIVTYTPPDTTPPEITITLPTQEIFFETEKDTLDLGGIASDPSGVKEVSWSSSAGHSGLASGTDLWRVTGIPLSAGDNVIEVKATDEPGNQGVDTLTVRYNPPLTGPPWTVLSEDGFEDSWGSYVDGGLNCHRDNKPKYAHQGEYVARLRSGEGESSSFYSAQVIDMETPGYTEMKIEFWFYPSSFESGEGFLVEYYDGNAWQLIKQYVVENEFVNYKLQHEEGVIIKESASMIFPKNMKLRFRCDASSTADIVYIDDVVVSVRGTPDVNPPSVSITSPTTQSSYTSETAVLDLAGSASDDRGVAEVSWTNSTGGSGIASGTDSWRVTGLPLKFGENVISVTATDLSGKTQTVKITVTYIPPWTVLSEDGFEDSWGSYVDGGLHCHRDNKPKYAHQGDYVARLRSNKGEASSFYSANDIDMDTPDYREMKIEFWFYPSSFESGEDFFVEYYDGSEWQVIKQYVVERDFNNYELQHEEGVIVNESASMIFPRNMKLRFRCDASATSDIVYIDDVVVSVR
ncbi:MAG: hypothetical protein D3926_07070 [Desulfobacteraceae bacterium]|nr:MAG: hypothetical protein D3926_07070 [Desulfobacteraceae bacterium]